MKLKVSKNKTIQDSDWPEYIGDLSEEQIEFFINLYKEKVIANRKSTKYLGSTFILALVIYYLLKNSIIEEVSFMSLKISNIEVILRFIPLLLSGLIFRISSGLRGSIKREGLLDELYRNRYKELNEHPLFDYVLATGTRWQRKKNKKNKLLGCLMAPFTLFSSIVIFFLMISFVPIFYIAVGESIWNALHSSQFDYLQILITVISSGLLVFSIREIFLYFIDEYYSQKAKNKNLNRR